MLNIKIRPVYERNSLNHARRNLLRCFGRRAPSISGERIRASDLNPGCGQSATPFYSELETSSVSEPIATVAGRIRKDRSCWPLPGIPKVEGGKKRKNAGTCAGVTPGGCCARSPGAGLNARLWQTAWRPSCSGCCWQKASGCSRPGSRPQQAWWPGALVAAIGKILVIKIETTRQAVDFLNGLTAK